MAIDLSQLGDLSKDQLQELLQGAKKQISSIQDKERSKKEEEFVEDLAPYKEKMAALEDQVKKVADSYDQKINEMKDKKKEAIEKARTTIEEHLNKYNEFRKDKGLAPVSLSTRKRSSGKQHSYEVIWPTDANDNSRIQIKVDENDPSDWIDITGTVSVPPLKAHFEQIGVTDESGGKVRGLINRIKKERSLRDAKKKEVSVG